MSLAAKVPALLGGLARGTAWSLWWGDRPCTGWGSLQHPLMPPCSLCLWLPAAACEAQGKRLLWAGLGSHRLQCGEHMCLGSVPSPPTARLWVWGPASSEGGTPGAGTACAVASHALPAPGNPPLELRFLTSELVCAAF